MILLPIGVENHVVDRVPVVSAAIALACVAMYVVSVAEDVDIPPAPEVEERIGELVDQLNSVNGLRVPEPCAHLLHGETEPADVDPSELVENQARADRLCDRAIAAIEALPVPATLSSRHGFVPKRGLLQHGLLTYIFLHGGLLHLLGNMLFFYISGPSLEDRWGRVVFPLFFLVGGALAAVAQGLAQPASTIPVIGASGAVAATMGGFSVRYFNRRVKMLFFTTLFFRFIVRTFHIPAWLWGGLWFGLEVLNYKLEGASAGGVAVMAHIGGFAFGATAAALLAGSGFEAKFLRPRIEKKTEWTFSDDDGAPGAERRPPSSKRAPSSARDADLILDARARGDAAGAAVHLADGLKRATAARDVAHAVSLVDAAGDDVDLSGLRPAMLFAGGQLVERERPDSALYMYAAAARVLDLGAAKPLLRGAQLLVDRGRASDAAGWARRALEIRDLPEQQRADALRIAAQKGAESAPSTTTAPPVGPSTFNRGPDRPMARGGYDARAISLDDQPPVEDAPPAAREVFRGRVTGVADRGLWVELDGVGAMKLSPRFVRAARARFVAAPVPGAPAPLEPVLVVDVSLRPEEVQGRHIGVRFFGDTMGLEALVDHAADPWSFFVERVFTGALPEPEVDVLRRAAVEVVPDLAALERAIGG